MIFYINPLVFNPSNPKEDFEALASIFRSLAEDFHRLMSAEWATSIHPNFPDFENFKNQYLSKTDISNFENITLKKTPTTTKLLKTYLTIIRIGYETKEIPPTLAKKIIYERSYIVVENQTNDWRMLQGVCEKYTLSTKSKRSGVYAELKNAFSKERIKSENAGGNGTKAAIEHLNTGILQNILKYKAMCIFDSDRDASTTNVKKDYGNLIAFIKQTSKSESGYSYADCVYKETDLLIWHIWYKRELENYVPIGIILQRTDIDQSVRIYLENLIATSDDERLDFLKFSKKFDALPSTPTLGIPNHKDVFPKFFSEPFSYELLEAKCAHHKVTEPLFCAEEISEMELVLLKIAKII